MRYTVLFRCEEDAYVVRVPSLPGRFIQGPNLHAALDRAREASTGHVAALRDVGEPVPIEEMPPIVATVEVDPAA